MSLHRKKRRTPFTMFGVNRVATLHFLIISNLKDTGMLSIVQDTIPNASEHRSLSPTPWILWYGPYGSHLRTKNVTDGEGVEGKRNMGRICLPAMGQRPIRHSYQLWSIFFAASLEEERSFKKRRIWWEGVSATTANNALPNRWAGFILTSSRRT